MNIVIKLVLLLVQLSSLAKCSDTYNLTFNTNELENSHPATTGGQIIKSNAKTPTKKLKYHESWLEMNETIVFNCSLRVNRDQHVVWHRKYDKMGVHVLTIGSETFISDLRIRPIKQQFSGVKSSANIPSNTFVSSASASSSFDYNSNMYSAIGGDDDAKFTWNLEIRRLRKEDSALYYCVLNSENAYGQIYKLNVMRNNDFFLLLFNSRLIKIL